MDACYVFFEVGTEFLNIIHMSFVFKRLMLSGSVHQDLIYSVYYSDTFNLFKIFSVKIVWKCHRFPCS
jgi:hypothetical protein